ncbi:hypothetical protein [Nocardioides sp. LHG3406-4]|uniref:hypothetical protein n=1 Tax=Nocardioides sp. LHG3406-4 TaxID=2804575 RepID=UPI003CEC0848
METGLTDAREQWLLDARESGVIPRVSIGLEYDQLPRDPGLHSGRGNELTRVRRHRDYWDVQMVRDIARLRSGVREQIDREIEAVVKAVKDAVREKLSKLAR